MTEKTSERPLEKVTIAYSSISGNKGPLWITHDRSGFIDRLYMTQPVVASRDDQRSTQGPAGIKEKSLLTIEKRKAPLTAAKSVGPAFSDSSREYVVATGDNVELHRAQILWKSIRMGKIYEANKSTMKNPNYISVGQRIIIPS